MPLLYNNTHKSLPGPCGLGGSNLHLDISLMSPVITPSSSGATKMEDSGRLSPATLRLIDEVCTNAEINTPDIKDIESLTFPSAAGLKPSGYFENSFQLDVAETGVSNDLLFGTDPLLSTPLNSASHSMGQKDMYINNCKHPTELKQDTALVLDDYFYGEPNLAWDASPPLPEIPSIGSPSSIDGNILNQAVEISGITEDKEPLFNWEIHDIGNINVLEDVDTQLNEPRNEGLSNYTTLQQLSPPAPSPIFHDHTSESLFNNFHEPKTHSKRTRRPPQRYSDNIVIEESLEDYNEEEVTVSIEEPPTKKTKFSLKGLSEAEKYRRIREQNNAASKKCRSKRKEDMNKKTLEMEALQEENNKLRKQYEAMKEKLDAIRTEWQSYQSNHVG